MEQINVSVIVSPDRLQINEVSVELLSLETFLADAEQLLDTVVRRTRIAHRKFSHD